MDDEEVRTVTLRLTASLACRLMLGAMDEFDMSGGEAAYFDDELRLRSLEQIETNALLCRRRNIR